MQEITCTLCLLTKYNRNADVRAKLRLYAYWGIGMTCEIIKLVKARRKRLGLTQQTLAERAGVGLRFVRELEQGKQTLRLDKVNRVLAMFGHKVGPIALTEGNGDASQS